jgi:signal transduction histidine kinase
MVDVDLMLDGRAAIDLPEEETIQLLHIAREALSNVARHSRATRATIELSAPDMTTRLVIADNGGGFPVGVARGPGHQGLVNMRGRASGLGGRLDVESELGRGTRIIVTVPRLDGQAEDR